jgi:hypothetical protein
VKIEGEGKVLCEKFQVKSFLGFLFHIHRRSQHNDFENIFSHLAECIFFAYRKQQNVRTAATSVVMEERANKNHKRKIIATNMATEKERMKRWQH